MQELMSGPEDASLLREISHRHSNALQILSSSLGRIERSTSAAIPLGEVRRFRDQIGMLAELNRKLSISPTEGEPLQGYLKDLGRHLLGAFDRQDIVLEIRAIDAQLSADRQFKLGLLVVELITNAIKHGGDEAGALISVDVAYRGAARLELRVTNPAGGRLPPIGLPRIAAELARMLHGELRVRVGARYAAHVEFGAADPGLSGRAAWAGMPGGHGCPRNKVFHWNGPRS